MKSNREWALHIRMHSIWYSYNHEIITNRFPLSYTYILNVSHLNSLRIHVCPFILIYGYIALIILLNKNLFIAKLVLIVSELTNTYWKSFIDFYNVNDKSSDKFYPVTVTQPWKISIMFVSVYEWLCNDHFGSGRCELYRILVILQTRHNSIARMLPL